MADARQALVSRFNGSQPVDSPLNQWDAFGHSMVPMPPMNSPKPLGEPSKPLTGSFFNTVWKAMGNRGPAPPVYSFVKGDEPYYGVKEGSAWGFQPNENRGVYVRDDVARGLQKIALGFDPNKPQPGTQGYPTVNWPSLDVLNVLAHEYTHVSQPRPLRMGMREAGAVVGSEEQMASILKALGMSIPPGRYRSFAYPHWVASLLHRPDAASFVRHGQFGESP